MLAGGQFEHSLNALIDAFPLCCHRPQADFGGGFAAADGFVPQLAAPPRPPPAAVFADTASRFNPFDKSGDVAAAAQYEQARPSAFASTPPGPPGAAPGQNFQRTDSAETPPTPLFDEDTSYPLEDFPRIHYDGPGWEMQLRQPNRKKITGQRCVPCRCPWR